MKWKTVFIIFFILVFLFILSKVDTNIYAFNISIVFFTIGTLSSIYFFAKKEYTASFICLVSFGSILWILLDIKNTEQAKIHREIFTVLWRNDCEYTGENVPIDDVSVALVYKCKNGEEVSIEDIRNRIIKNKFGIITNDSHD